MNSEPYSTEAKNNLNIPYLKNLTFIKKNMLSDVSKKINIK